MTPEEVRAFTDAQLSFELALRVMSWEYVEHPGGVKFWQWPAGSRLEDAAGVRNICNWSPPTSLLDAALCTDKMRAIGWHFVINLYADKCVILAYRNMYKSVEDFSVEHERRDRAEAEASLLAVLKEKNDA
jgi:hypothetical protein